MCIQGAKDNLSPFQIINFVHAICFSFSQLYSKLESVGHTVSEESSTMTQFTPPETWKRLVVLLAVTSEELIWGFQSFYVPIWEQCRIFEKNWMSATIITKARQPGSIVLIVLIRPPEFVGEIQAMIDNDPCKSIRSIVRDMGIS